MGPVFYCRVVPQQLLELVLADNRVGKKRAVIGNFGRIGQISITKRDHSFANNSRTEASNALLRKIALQRFVKWRSWTNFAKAQGKRGYHEAPLIRNPKAAGAISEPTIVG